MYSTSDKYKELIYSGKKCLLNIYIDGTLINDDDIYSFKVSHNLFDGGKVSLGSTTSKSIELEINSEALPETYTNFYIETGLTIDGVDEIVPIGHFTLENITKDDDVVSITAVDYMMKFEKTISDTVTGTALEIVQAICDICSVELATSDFIGNDTELSITDTNLTARQIIGYIAELAGGFSFVGRDGKLYFKTIGTDTTEIDIDLFGDYSWGEEFVCNEVDFINDNYDYEISDTDYSSAYLDCVLDSEFYGNEMDGQSLNINTNNPFIETEEQVYTIYQKIKGLTLNSFSGQVIVDPALDIGDIIYIDDKPVVYQGDMEYLGYFKGNISSTIDTEEKSNTTVQAISLATKLNRVSNAVDELETEVENKVDSNKIISEINKSDEEVQIQAEKVSLRGKKMNFTTEEMEIESDNFNLDKEGNMTCNNANIKGTIYNGDGEKLLSQDGVFISIPYISNYVANGQIADISQIGYYFSIGWYMAYLKIDAYIPKKFVVTSAFITITHQPIEYNGITYEDGSGVNLDGVVGYARNVQIYYNASEFSEKYSLQMESEYRFETSMPGTNTKALGSSGKTFNSNDVEIVTSSDLSGYLESGKQCTFLIGSTSNSSNITSMKDMYQKTGRAIATLNVYGYQQYT